VLGKAKEEKKRISNIEHGISKDEGRKDTAVSWKKIVIIASVYEDHHGPKGTSPKSGWKERKMKIREIISNIQHSTPNIQDKKNGRPTSNREYRMTKGRKKCESSKIGKWQKREKAEDETNGTYVLGRGKREWKKHPISNTGYPRMNGRYPSDTRTRLRPYGATKREVTSQNSAKR
jgi:hypothetical protein